MSRRRLHLNINILNAGFYGSAWRAPQSDPTAFVDVGHFVKTARIAERGTFDAVFLADVPTLSDRPELRPYQALEPTIVLATIAAHTSHIGLIGTASSTYNDPYNIARRFASLDLASGGRVGWNVVTTAEASASRNFGFDAVTAHAARYERAAEFTEVVTRLWDSWEDGALVADKASGRFVDLDRVHAIDHVGPHFRVSGPLNVPRSPQGRPVVIQAGGSDDGRQLAAAHAEAIFSVAHTIAEATAFAADIRGRAARLGRDPSGIVFLPGLGTLLGSTEAEARRREDELWSLIPGDYSLRRLAGVLQLNPESIDLDTPLPTSIPLPADGGHTFFLATLQIARRDGLTVRQLLRKLGGSTGHRLFIGTPKALADEIEAWFLAGAADGFNLMPDVLPDGLEIFVDEVVPILRRRGIFRSTYDTRTLRGHFGLVEPDNVFARTARAAV
ncbi:LLM class flavin-dependent oxidoreductase [Chelatococcus asaccharovorans]|uniref:FMN-dependent oxidoreductase (Nitrilotriacetate monooxygenase family) n=1 Tax=Chelatococcus asaccharovorans TaxID=28210 RepID=A0A2V3U4R3_9HYPH|nr:LLM class flavin-dependent oxidoreductase [Chelatococcus asaccharovorans]MBS7703770.1 LLM class flavin-dependent oxidoreductase [Chelatococcus asaccharovorans]PXW57930.1 FMN-dependent oxidoreductase (nitrilotriacetate monooxygenase family) [Chelatococcus asaccharovorans]